MLSPQSKYALRALIHLARQPHGAFIRVEEIAKESSLPAPYLSKILKMLASREIIVSRRGKNGGVQLNRSREPSTFFEICEAIEDPIVKSECVLFKKACDMNNPCAFHPRWSKTKQRLLDFLRATRVE